MYSARWKWCMPSQTMRSVFGGSSRVPPDGAPEPRLWASATLTMVVVAFSRRRKWGRTVSRILSAVRAPSARTSDVAMRSCKRERPLDGHLAALQAVAELRDPAP